MNNTEVDTKPNEQVETGKLVHDKQFHPWPERRSRFTKLTGRPIRSGPVRLDPTGEEGEAMGNVIAVSVAGSKRPMRGTRVRAIAPPPHVGGYVLAAAFGCQGGEAGSRRLAAIRSGQTQSKSVKPKNVEHQPRRRSGG